MSTNSDQDTIDRVTRTSQIFVGAVIAGVLVLLGIATVVGLRPTVPAQAGAGAGRGAVQGNAPDAHAGTGARVDRGVIDRIITYTAVAFAAVILPLSLVVPGVLVKQIRRSIAAGTWAVPTQGSAPAQRISPEALQIDAGKL